MTCEFCDDFISAGRQNAEPKFRRLHKPGDWDSLLASAARCVGCRFLQQVLEAGAPEDTAKVRTAHPLLVGSLGAQSRRLTVYVTYDVSMPGEGRVRREIDRKLYIYSPQETPWPCILVHPSTSPDPPRLETAIPILQSWLSGCDAKDQCVDPAAKVQLPTRLIDVGSESTSPRLRQTAGMHGQYLALSHCWGPPNKQPIRTLEENLASHYDEIPLDSFPPTFRDSILVTRALGFRYIWIDSLCIIQDSPRDWASESSRMAQVYRHASLTLAAEFAESAEFGLFLRNPSSAPKTRMFTQTDSHGNIYPLFVRIDGQGWGVDQDPSCYTAESTRVLETRGWTLQERLLSRRIVSFTNAELTWECGETRECSCGNYPGEVAPVKNNFETSLARNPQEYRNAQEYREVLVEPWHHIVEDYTRRKLTYPSDRLPGLTGVANLYPFPATDYLAGLWLHAIGESLSWVNQLGRDVQRRKIPVHSPPTLGENEPNFRISASDAPSWSWASISGPVAFNLGCYPKLVRDRDWVLTASKCIPKTVNPYGPVSKGYIEVEGDLIPISFREVLRDHMLEHGSDGMVKAFRNLCVIPTNQADSHADDKGETETWMDAGLGGQEWLDKNYDYFAFILGRRDHEFKAPVGMILRKKKRAEEMEFSRIGMSRLLDWRDRDWRAVAQRRRFRII